MLKQNNIQLIGANQRPFLLDIYRPASTALVPVVVFAHGFKGFKDWGHWDFIAEYFAQAGMAFVKFNFSHNGTTVDQPMDFADLEAFGTNNYTREMADLDTVFAWLTQQAGPLKLNMEKVGLIGHSRGGALAIVYAAHHPIVRRLVTWASVHGLDYFWHDKPDLVSTWRNDGVLYLRNSRTGQDLPLGFQLYEDVDAHGSAYQVKEVLADLDIPLCAIHGTADPSIKEDSSKLIASWAQDARLVLVTGADHVFGGRHPFTDSELPPHSQELVRETLQFFAPFQAF